MSQVQEMKDVLYHEMEVAIRSTQNLLMKVFEDHWTYQPQENMRTLKELATHLVSIPAIDLYIMQEESHETIQQLEAKYEALTTADDMCVAFEDGYNKLKEYMNTLSDDDFLHKTTKAFYMEKGQSQAQWLMEVMTHMFHHRAQLFNYLKQLEYDVSMFDLYV
ncbi:DinB family protein [Aquisalibacillus elongatus]|uniref:Putative damage-inducible protein DinB n=1 Tax=Aquisalibacillus elongatus TaxID=485577 RepID=A0A3N5BD08_9BACI|nr:DinB family protein [Aquisalibacillus elongatus]RPF53220.1 putative damage-inducible protein DinB [Aquisalibacillus elongatus]